MTNEEQSIRELIFEKVREFYRLHKSRERYVPGESRIQYSGRVFDHEEMVALVDSALDFWLTLGRYGAEFEREFACFLGLPNALLTNSGSSANLLAVSALTSPKLDERRLRPGDEVITVAASFPTTINPLIQNGFVPVFLDVDIGTYNVQAARVEAAVTPRTRAILLAHTLGNPFDVDVVMSVARRHDLWVIEDCCDALGSTYNGKLVGTFGDIATFSFYPAHHITMGEGGALVTANRALMKIVKSFRDWGRDCWCDPGKENTCGKRFGWQLGQLPYGYDHKYTYSHIGYNLKPTDLQAAVGTAQLKKLPFFIERRKQNFQSLYQNLKKYADYLILPQSTPKSDPSWFGFPITVREDSGFVRSDIVSFLEKKGIATRMLFAGNIIRQPAYQGVTYRIFDNLANTDLIMSNTFWVGVYPGLTDEMINFVIQCFGEFFAKHGNRNRRLNCE